MSFAEELHEKTMKARADLMNDPDVVRVYDRIIAACKEQADLGYDSLSELVDLDEHKAKALASRLRVIANLVVVVGVDPVLQTIILEVQW